METSKNKLWDAVKTASYLSVTVKTLYKMCKEGKIPHVRAGNQYRFNPDAIMQWASGETQEKGENTQGQPIIGNEGQV